MKDRVIKALVWMLPPRFLFWAVIRGFADASSGRNSSRCIDGLRYKDVHDAILEKYNLKI